jgi:hypothetical protein
MAVDPIIECFGMDLVPEYCEGLESSAVYAAPLVFVECVHGRSNRSLPRLPLHMHSEDIILTLLKSNIYIGIFLPKPLTLPPLWSQEML